MCGMKGNQHVAFEKNKKVLAQLLRTCNMSERGKIERVIGKEKAWRVLK